MKINPVYLVGLVILVWILVISGLAWAFIH